MREGVLVSDGSEQPGLGPDAHDAPDAARIRDLVGEHFDFIWRSLRRFGMADGSVDDAAQKVFLVAAKKIGSVAKDRERAFLLAIALRVAAAERRRVRRQRLSGDEDDLAALPAPLPGPDELVDRKKARILMNAILDRLPLECRAVLVLYEMEEYTMTEIAALLELPSGTVASRLRRARELFEDEVKRYKARSRRGVE